MGGCLLPFPSGLPRARGLLLFSLLVLRPGGSQYPGRFHLRAAPSLFIRRESTSSLCLGSHCLILERRQEQKWGPGVSNQTGRSTVKGRKAPAEPALSHQGTGAGEQPVSLLSAGWGLIHKGPRDLVMRLCWECKDVCTGQPSRRVQPNVGGS